MKVIVIWNSHYTNFSIIPSRLQTKSFTYCKGKIYQQEKMNQRKVNKKKRRTRITKNH